MKKETGISVGNVSTQFQRMAKTQLVDCSLIWLHCNECHRSFEHHNRLSDETSDGLKVLRSDLEFAFTSCGHFYCQNCIQQHTIGDKLICTLCQCEATTFQIDNLVPKGLEMYLKSPMSLLEDSISVMNFQLSNANSLIKGLRTKVSQQKELLAKAKSELASQKILKEKLAEVQKENERLKHRMDDITRAAGISNHPIGGIVATPGHKVPDSPIPNRNTPANSIHVPGRLSLRSPIRVTPAQNMNFVNGNYSSGNFVPRSPTISEIFVQPQGGSVRGSYPNGSQHQQLPDGGYAHHQAAVIAAGYGYQDLAQPIYETPLTNRSKYPGLPPPNARQPFGIRPQIAPPRLVPPSPRSVHRQYHDSNRNFTSSGLREP